uniref:alanine transaminase n=1 Tax=Mayetiola destructor TaxID=39758 RepID=V5SIX2_MAYDE|nr:alanine transaminase [Mayetiola destructor]
MGQCQLISSFKIQNQASPLSLKEAIHFPQTIEEWIDSKPKIPSKTLTLNTMNENIIRMEHVVRGALTDRAGQLDKEIKRGNKKSFPDVIFAHIGDCHSMGQPYITFLRQVLALVIDPSNLNESKYPEDAKQRARDILNNCEGGSIGAYSDAAGMKLIRQHVADYIQNRDGFPANYENIYLSSGASESIKAVMNLFNCKVNGKVAGILAPIPQYPMYKATSGELGMHQIGYYVNDENIDISELERAVNSDREKCVPRVICIINPANPTGLVLTKKNIQEIIQFAYENKLFIMADEVYQDNIYHDNFEFHSFKKVLFEMGEPYQCMELASFMSCSKGYMGECGIRGGYVELTNFDPDVKEVYDKMAHTTKCSTTLGQVAVDVLVNPPKVGEPSYAKWYTEKTNVLKSLQKRAHLVVETLNTFEGFTCPTIRGAMYAFPRAHFPPKSIQAAKRAGQSVDSFYAYRLLEEYGVCIVPGSAFGHKPGAYYFRATILPQMDKLQEMLRRFETFNRKFMAEYK